MFAKILLIWQRYICTGYRISTRWYRGTSTKLVGTGQGNKFSGEFCRDISYLIIKQIKELNLGFKFVSYFIETIE